ncbi:uncharacterized protein F54H12.2-like [Mytilus edulis]|uniref:uncharacterized protein F54H12.2-like n=2 Tax=Mytilus edulis TaxID=6550 RepID=UPI0039F08EB3
MAALNVADFHEAQPSGLSLFSLPPYQSAVERMYFQEVRSNSQLTGNIIDMEITGKHGMEYVDLKRSKLYVKAKLVKGDGSNLTENEYVGPINLFLQSMFSQVEVAMQGKLVSSTTNHYPYKAMIQTLLTYGSESKTSQLTSQFWIKDVAGHLDDNDVNGGSNSSLNTRARYFAQSKTGDMEGPLCHDLFHMNRYILNQVAINVRLTRTRPEFCLMTNEVAPDFKVIIEDIVLKACKIQINPAVIYGHAEILKSVNAKYPFIKTEVKQITVAAGTVNFAQDQLFQNIRPNRVVVGFVNALAAAGDYTKNPFNFQHFNLNQIGVFVDNIPVSGNLMRLNFDTSSGRTIVPAFNSMFEVTDKWACDSGNQLNRNDFAGGYALYCFEIEPNFGDDGSYLHLLKQGNVRLEVQFSSALRDAISCIVYAEYPGYFEINAARDVILER